MIDIAEQELGSSHSKHVKQVTKLFSDLYNLEVIPKSIWGYYQISEPIVLPNTDKSFSEIGYGCGLTKFVSTTVQLPCSLTGLWIFTILNLAAFLHYIHSEIAPSTKEALF